MSSKMKESKKLLAESQEIVMCTILSLLGGMFFKVTGLLILGGVAAVYMVWECISTLIPSKKTKLDDTFRLLDMKNKDDIMPYVLSEGESSEGHFFCLRLPVGMEFSDFKNKTDELESAFGCRVDVRKGHTPDTVIIQFMQTKEGKANLKYEEIFCLCGLKNSNGDTPQLLQSGVNDGGEFFVFSVPKGMKLDDFMGKKKELQNAFKGELYLYTDCHKGAIVIQRVKSDELKHKLWLINVFELCGLKNKVGDIPVVYKEVKNNLGTQYRVQLPIGMKIQDIQAKKSELQVALGYELEIMEGESSNKINIQLIENALGIYKVNLDDDIFNLDNLGELEFPIGMMQTENGLEVASLDYDKCERHILVNGGTGAGKSTVLRLIYAMAILRRIPIHAIDSKGTEAGVFKHYKDMIISIYTSDGVRHLEALSDVMAMRYRIMYIHDAKDYRAFNTMNVGFRIEPMLIIIDEFAPYRKNKECKEILSNLLSMSRAAGMYIILSTQRIDSEAMGDLKTNLGIRLSMRAETEADSMIAMGTGDTRAYKLKVPGRLYMKYNGKQDTLVQSFLLSETDCLSYLSDIGVLHENYKCIEPMFTPEYDIDVVTGKPLRAGESQSIDLKPYMINDVSIKSDEIDSKLSQIRDAIKATRESTDTSEDLVCSDHMESSQVLEE